MRNIKKKYLRIISHRIAGIAILIQCLAAGSAYCATEAPVDNGSLMEVDTHVLESIGLNQLLPDWIGEKQLARTRVIDPYIDLRTGPGRGYPIFYVAERDEWVTVLKQRTTWVKVRNRKDIEGWVHVDQMARTLGQDEQPLAFNRFTLEDYVKRRWEAGFMLGDFGGTDAISAYAGYHFTRNLSLELAVSETLGEYSNGRATNVSIVHQPFPGWRYSPFFTLGGGIRETEPRSSLVRTHDRKNDTLNVGAGIRVYLSRHFLLRFQYKHHTILTNRDDDEEVGEWTLGLSTFF